MQTQILSELNTADADLAALAAQLDVPTVIGLQHQGDVSVVPAHMASDYRPPINLVPAAGVPVVRGESGGNTHLLLASGEVYLDVRQASAENLTLACLNVTEGATAWLDHPEHGNSGIGPGTYVLRRKREQADELRMVAD